MEKKTNNLYFIVSLIIYIVLNIFINIYKELYLYNVNTGTIAFFTTAQKYIRGDFSNAIVGGFTPLSSWLLIPFLKFGLDPVLSLSIVKLIVGLLVLIGIRLLSYRFEMTENIRNIISFSAVPIVLQFTLTENIPDLLIVCTFVYYLNLIFNTDYPEKAYKGILCGVIGGIGYLGKAFMFPFFLSHFLMLNILHYLRTKSSKVLRNAILGFLLFFIIGGPWMVALSKKYDKITFDISGTYNHRIIGPEIKKVSVAYGWEGWRNNVLMGHPVYDQGFFPPPNDTAISIWEDFTLLFSYLEPWSPFESLSNFKYQVGLIVKNIYYTVGIFETYFSIFSIVIIAAYILLYLLPVRSDILRDHKIYPLATAALFCGGYILVYPTVRYLWPINILILLMGGHILNELFKSEFFNKARKNLLIIFFALSFIFMPLKEAIRAHSNKNIWMLGSELQKYSEMADKKIASNDKFSETLKVLFYSDMNVKYYGQAKANISDGELQGELKKHDIDYYLVWSDPDSNDVIPFLSDKKEITGGTISFENSSGAKKANIRIYSLKDQ